MPGFINTLLLDLKFARIMIQKICLISYKLELGLQGESVDGQEAIEGSSVDQLYDEIWELYREYEQQCSLFFILKLDSNHANHICIIMNYNIQYKDITVIINSFNPIQSGGGVYMTPPCEKHAQLFN